MAFLTAFGLRATRVTGLMMVLLILLGVVTYLNFPKREDPAIIVRTAIVTASNPGLTVEQLEELVARPLEEVARGVPGVDEVRTQITSGSAILQVDIANSVPENDLKRVFDEIRDDIEASGNRMPDGTNGPLVNTDFGDVTIASVAIAGDDFSYHELEEMAKDLRDRFYRLDSVSGVSIYGVQERQIRLEVDRTRLASIGTTIDPLVAALQGQNVRLEAGSITSEGTRVPLEVSGDFQSIEEIEQTLIELPDIGLIRLGDIIQVHEGYALPPEKPVYFNGQRAVVVAVEMAAGKDIVAVGEELLKVSEAFRATLPVGITAEFATYQPEKVGASVNNAMINVLQTLAVVLLVMLLFLGYRQALIIAMIVPFTVSFAFLGMGPLGIELQQVSIAAIIISLGLLVDNGLVIVEDMDRRIQEGEPRKSAALSAGGQYATPLMIASVTTVSAFLPLFLLEGSEGEYGYSLGAVVALMLAGSFITALYILPTLATWFLPDAKASPSGKASETRKPGFFDRLAEAYAAVLKKLLAVPAIVIIGMFGLVFAAGSLMGFVSSQLFPLSDRNQLLLYVDMPKGTDITETEALSVRLADWLNDRERNPEIKNNIAYVGDGGPRFVLSLDPADSDPTSSFFVVNTTDFETSLALEERLRKELPDTFPEARIRIKRLAMGGSEPGVEIELSGPDANTLLSAAYEVEAAFAGAPGLTQNYNDWGSKQLIGQVNISQDRVREYDLTSQEISQALEGFFDGTQISVFRQDTDQIPIILRGEEGFRDSFEDLANTSIGENNQIISLDQIATVLPRLEFSTLRRVDQQRQVKISVTSDQLSSYELYDYAATKLDALQERLGPEYLLHIGGEIESAGEVTEKLGGGLPATFAVILIALMVQFNSIRRVGLILATIPLVIVGVPLGLIAFNQPLSFFGMLGLISLSGIIINNAIVMIDQIDIERNQMSLKEAIITGAKKRFRPILLTSLTTVLGLMPMATTGGALWEPMATLMIGGLGIAAILALFFVPAFYALIFKDPMPTKEAL